VSGDGLKMPFCTLRWDGGTAGRLVILDQRKLPGEAIERACVDAAGVHDAIRTLAVRGAPAIGVAAGYGVVLGMRGAADESDLATGLKTLRRTTAYLATSRPTAVNLFWALERVVRAGEAFAAATPGASAGELKQKLLEEADRICAEDRAMCAAIGQNGEPLIPERAGILTHCNAGALATAGIGTALAPIYMAHAKGKQFRVYVDETRPLLQGARLTMWELLQAGIEATLICDNMAATVMKQGRVKAVITGADRIAANGDTANKIGTLGAAILARHFGIPFYVAAPSSTFDLAAASGAAIPIEQRDGEEVTAVGTCRVAPMGAGTYNPAFDVTEAAYITAIVTEKGILRPPFEESIRAMMGGGA
jgi:methylthioribose-1-phosphate isomerase